MEIQNDSPRSVPSPGLYPLSPARKRDRNWKVLAYALAVVLPITASALTAHFLVLQTIPFSLYFISITLVASLGGLAPALVGMVCSELSRNYFLLPNRGILHIDSFDLIRLGILMAAAAVISAIAGRRKKAAEELETALALLQDRSSALIESLHGGRCASWILDLDLGQSPRWYAGSYEIFGRPFAVIEAMPTTVPLLHVEDQPRLEALRDQMMTTREPVVMEYRVPWPNGEIHHLEMRATRIDGPRNVWRGLTVDLTERKLAEAAVLRSEKLAAMGRLASTVAHEINNPLEAVTNLLYLIRTDDSLSEVAREYLSTAETELARLSEITRLTLGFVRTSATRRTVVVDDVVENVLTLFRQRFTTRGIVVEREYEQGLEIHMAPHELRQIVTNLVSNASDAVSGKDCRIRVRIGAEGPKAVIVVEDSGHGIADHDLARIFDPFFTTKDDIGTGIGLWVTKELVESNGGRVLAESGDLERGMKTRFRVELPLPPEGFVEPPTGVWKIYRN